MAGTAPKSDIEFAQEFKTAAAAMRTFADVLEKYATNMQPGSTKRSQEEMNAEPEAPPEQSGSGKDAKVKKLRDPNYPKRPLTDFFIFQSKVRPEVQASLPDAKAGDVLHMISQQWAQMSDEQKAPFSAQARQNMVEWQKACQDYLGSTEQVAWAEAHPELAVPKPVKLSKAKSESAPVAEPPAPEVPATAPASAQTLAAAAPISTEPAEPSKTPATPKKSKKAKKSQVAPTPEASAPPKATTSAVQSTPAKAATPAPAAISPEKDASAPKKKSRKNKA